MYVSQSQVTDQESYNSYLTYRAIFYLSQDRTWIYPLADLNGRDSNPHSWDTAAYILLTYMYIIKKHLAPSVKSTYNVYTRYTMDSCYIASDALFNLPLSLFLFSFLSPS